MRFPTAALLAVLVVAQQPAAGEELTVALAPPVVVATQPQAGQSNVPPGPAEIRVTFSRPMKAASWSWVKISDASFPKTAGNAHFLEDRRTCVLPVTLEPGKSYAIWLNQPPYENFQAEDGTKALPYLLTFATRR